MIENLAEHGVRADDLVPSLMTTHTVANPEYDPAEAHKRDLIRKAEEGREKNELPDVKSDDMSETTLTSAPPPGSTTPTTTVTSIEKGHQTTARVLEDTSTAPIPGVTTTLSSADEKVTLDIRWTILCDLFLILFADS